MIIMLRKVRTNGKNSMPIWRRRNIQKRGRDYEQKMPIDYLEGINLLYDDFIMNKYKGRVLLVEVDNLDFEHNPKQFGDIIDKIDAKLFGFFSKEE